MKREVSRILCLGAAVCLFLGPCTGFARYCSMAARSSCISAQGQIQNNLESTLNLLKVISGEPWMLPGDIPYQQKAEHLDHYNEIWGYQMIRAVDTSGGVYRADHEEAVSNLNSREYIQALWVTNEPQITDVFLAGADGTTLNYTVAVAVDGDAKNNGAVFAAIYDSKMRAILASQPMHTILLGKSQQCMSGNDEDSLGATLETRLEGKKIIGESLESALLRVKSETSGTIWFLDGLIPTCYAFETVGLESGWVVLSTASYADVVGQLIPAIAVSAVGIILCIAAFILLRRSACPAAAKAK